MYSAMDLSRYIVNFCIDIENPISNLKLQKILYYVQAAFLLEEGKPCFNEDIIMWRHGPVVVEVYNNYSIYIGTTIYEKQLEYEEYEFGADLTVKHIKKRFDANIIQKRHQELINEVVLGLINIEDWDLVAKTKEETPCIETEINEIISITSIYDYFNKSYKNEARIYGRYKHLY